jgi:succinate dehydrogenase assembly factor 2
MSFSRSAIASLRATRAIRLQVRYLATTPRLRRDVDPFPLPLSDPELAAAASRVPSSGDKLSPEDAELLMPKPLDRTGEDEKTIRARLVYQTRKRGMLEGDLLLSTFARDSLDAMSLAEMQEFDKVSKALICELIV